MPRPAEWDYTAIEQSPFLKLLTDWMWSHRPPLSVMQVSYKTGIPKQTIWAWLRDGNIPNPSTLERLAQGTGLSLAELYAVNGYSVSGEMKERERDPFLDMIARVQRDPRFSAASKQALIDSIRRVELGEERAARERMIYSEQHTTIESEVVTRDEAAVEAEDAPTAPLPVPPTPQTRTPQRSQRTSPRPRRRETPARSSPVKSL